MVLGFVPFLTLFFINFHGYIACPQQWREYNGHCYRAVNGSFSPQAARSACLLAKSDLVSINDESEDIFVKGLWSEIMPGPVTVGFTRMAIGLNLTRTSSGSIIGASWNDGSNLTYGNPLGQNFVSGTFPWGNGSLWGGGPSEPKNATTALCGAMVWNTQSPGLWAATPCTGNTGGFVCEFAFETAMTTAQADNVSECQTNYTPFSGSCYKVVTTTTSTFEIAQSNCQREGGNLASINSETEQTFIEGLLSRMMPSPPVSPAYQRIFIGFLANRSSSGVIDSVSWKDGSAVTFGNPTSEGFFAGDHPWASGGAWIGVVEPKSNSDAHFGFIVKNSLSSGLWAVGNANVTGGYVCEIGMGGNGTTTAGTTQSSDGTSSGSNGTTRSSTGRTTSSPNRTRRTTTSDGKSTRASRGSRTTKSSVDNDGSNSSSSFERDHSYGRSDSSKDDDESDSCDDSS